MSRTESGGGMVDHLRDRIVNGLYFGNWQPGERLPSIRDIADAELVDRKTAAAAYHRLAEEGLVEIKSRSGVFLRDERSSPVRGRGPLEQMQRRWLGNAFDGGRALGLDTAAMVRLFQAVGEVEALPLPVVVDDGATAQMVAAELAQCIGLDARPVRTDRFAKEFDLADAALVVTTPYHTDQVSRLVTGVTVVTATLSLEPLYSLMARVDGTILIAVPNEWIAGRVEDAIRQRAPNLESTHIVVADAHTDLGALGRKAACVFVWPGCDVVVDGRDDDTCVKPVRLLSDATIECVVDGVLDAALRRASGRPGPAGRVVTREGERGGVSTSSGDAPRSATAASAD